MNLKKFNKVDTTELDVRYSNWLSLMIDLIEPKDLYLIGGRGTAKTQDILAKRMIKIFKSMPGSAMSYTADTYVNALGNLIPELREGWTRQKFFEDLHYVCDSKPLDHFDKPLKGTTEYKNTICTVFGNIVYIKSLDRPSVNAGISVVHLFGDEAKYHKEDKIKKAIPTLRGDSKLWGDCHYFMGKTFLTDMPDINDNEFDWILNMKDHMNLKQIHMILQTSLICNDIEWELYLAEQNKASFRVIQRIKDKLKNWYIRLDKIRKGSVFFAIVSSLVNLDVLKFEYILNQRESLTSYEEFQKAILSLSPRLEKGQRFYGNLADHHFYIDGYDYDYYDQFGLKSNISQCSEGLRYIIKNKPLEAGVDFGNMTSMVIGQYNGEYMRILKDMYTLTPESYVQLAEKFKEFFKTHQTKHLKLYYDRQMNNLRKQNLDSASAFKNAIERDLDGKPSGWFVSLMSLGQGNIPHGLEYDMCNSIMGEKKPRLPKLLIDKNECKSLKASLELAQVETKTGKDGKKMIGKVKTSEKKPTHRLPLESTNMSDAFKYLICRKEFISIFKSKY